MHPDWLSLAAPNVGGQALCNRSEILVMYPTHQAREISVLLRISRELDIVGDVTATVDNPSELVAWANILSDPIVAAWRGEDSGHRYVQVTATHAHEPVRGRVTAVLHCEQHPQFWHELIPANDLDCGTTQPLSRTSLSAAWTAMPITPPT
jgi:hypothetical protein